MFKVGDEVKIRENSEYFETQGMHGVGKILDICWKDILPYRVQFKYYHNAYSEQDLIGVKVTSWKDVLK